MLSERLLAPFARMTPPARTTALRLGAVIAAAMIAMPAAGLAQEGDTPAAGTPGAGTPAAGGIPPLPASCAVVAEELINPRAITVGEDGTVYIAEAGDGGDMPDPAIVGEGTPAPAEPVTFHGDTGRVTAISPDGERSVVVDGLTSYVFGQELVGPSGLAVDGDTLYVAVGGPGPFTAQIDAQGDANTVIAVDLLTGEVTTLADIGAYELETNPDPYQIDSNLGGLDLGADGLLYVADSGGNTLYSVDPESGDLQVVAVLDGLDSGGIPNEARRGATQSDPVPVGVVADPDGGVYVGLLTGAVTWGTPGSAEVWHVTPEGEVTVAASGLNMVVGVAVDGEGSLHATELSTNFFAGPPPAPGQVSMIGEDGTPSPIVSDLFLPYGLAFGPDGEVYVTVFASVMPGDPPAGMLLSCTAE
ncbi:MAG TPA: ScyD/ScyE family protein [Thermomicrobiales bacterium]|jgi:outer membrane protein assembly factor BamB|nr:ScyD/ScyE family protein [Thermomicrobiales bacterium]